jgi:glycosyltransferase involved in cell wall biosynthesis
LISQESGALFMKILIFISSMSSGGAERVVASLASYWRSKGCHVCVATIASEESDFYAIPDGVERVSLSLTSSSNGVFKAAWWNWKRVRALRRLLRSFGPDVAVSFMDQSNVLLAAAAVGLKSVRVIGSERNHPPRLPMGRAWEVLRRIFYGRLHAVVAQTGRTAEWLRRYTTAKHVVVIPNPVSIPLEDQSPTIPPPRRQADQKILLAVGRLCHQKGFDILIRSFSSVASQFPDWRLFIIGDGVDRSKLEEQVLVLGMSDRILLPGRAGNVGQWYQAADLFVMSSRFEGFPNALLEAMAYGVPSLSFDCDAGPGDIILDGLNGLLVRDGDEHALARALARMMGDPGLRQNLARNAARIQVQYSREEIGMSWDSLFRKVLA